MATFFGYGPPFFGGPQNVLSRQEDDRLIKNDIRQIILTLPGERDMRPEFGCRLRSAVFDLIVDSDISALENDIVSAIVRYEPRVTGVSANIVRDDARHGYTVHVSSQMKNNPLHTIDVVAFVKSPGA